MEINYIALLVSAVLALVFGFIWYSKALFGKSYMMALGMDMNMSPEVMKEKSKGMGKTIFAQLALSFIQVFALSYLIFAIKDVSAVMLALFVCIGFIMTNTAGGLLWSNYTKKNAWMIFKISVGYDLVLFTIFGFILCAWK